jgi:catechol-2,3-dioxygenase
MHPNAETSGPERDDLWLIEGSPRPQAVRAGRRVGLYHLGLEVDGSDDDLPALHARLTARPHFTLILGGVDSGFVYSLYGHDPDGNEVDL